ncbi:hypothetical protein LX78_02209 [Xanthomarina spongicola]|uniref:Uncharacterized protein n=1 Tax=Xanthomarina spongicola TaxID=570520 RepID=A0A316DJ67_9FLAO|nr:hypothetical protein LX78_02209 [Xanthomarina spongicola]
MKQHFGAILLFYKPYVIWSFIINIVITFVNPQIIPAIITKLFLTILLWYFLNESHAKRKLNFYRNLGISSLRLFSSIFIIDVLLMIIYLSFIKVFI